MRESIAYARLFSGAAAVSLVCAALPAAADSGSNAAIPDFSGMTVGWRAEGTDFKQIAGGPPMVINDAAHPHVINGGGDHPSLRFADVNNPNLTDFAIAGLKKVNDDVSRGKAVFSREARCWPTGVPTYDLDQADPVYFIQTPKEVAMIWQLDHQVRHIYLDVPHSPHLKPSWYGESVGHYEGNTLVVDTVGQNTETFVDNFRTPHSENLHVVERFYLTNQGKNLRADILVEDPATFKQPVKVFQTWRRVTDGPLIESSCAETSEDFFSYDVEPIPTALTFDF